jgi:hypothetical protein
LSIKRWGPDIALLPEAEHFASTENQKRYPYAEIVRLHAPSLVELVWSIEMCLPRGLRGSGASLQQAFWGRRVLLSLYGKRICVSKQATQEGKQARMKKFSANDSIWRSVETQEMRCANVTSCLQLSGNTCPKLPPDLRSRPASSAFDHWA